MIIVDRQADLFQVIAALREAGRFAGGLYGRQQKGNQNADDRDNDKQFDERKGAHARWGGSGPHETSPP